MGNTASTEALVWSIGSILSLFAVLGIVVYVVHRYGFFYGESKAVRGRLPAAGDARHAQPAGQRQVLPRRRAAVRRADLQRRPAGPLHGPSRQLLREVHRRDVSVQLGQDLAPATGDSLDRRLLDGHGDLPGPAGRPAASRTGQRLLVNILFVAAVAVTVGSLLGEVLGIKGYLGQAWFWLGHQGWEYLELGRLWQILLFGGLIFWLVVVYRAMVPVLQRDAGRDRGDGRPPRADDLLRAQRDLRGRLLRLRPALQPRHAPDRSPTTGGGSSSTSGSRASSSSSAWP